MGAAATGTCKGREGADRKGQVKKRKGLKRAGQRGRSSANREDLLSLSSPVQVCPAPPPACGVGTEGKGRPAAVLRTESILGTQGRGEQKSEGRSHKHTRDASTLGKSVLKHKIDCSLLVPLDLCLRCSWRRSSSLERHHG